MKEGGLRDLAPLVIALALGCSYTPTPDPDGLASATLRNIKVYGMTQNNSETSAKLQGEAHLSSATWFNIAHVAFVDHGGINLNPFISGPDGQTPGTSTGEFWYLDALHPDPAVVSLYHNYLTARIYALSGQSPMSLNLYIGHRMTNNQNCGQGKVMGLSMSTDDAPQGNYANRWTIMFAEDIKYYAESCVPFPRPSLTTVFGWHATHELGHQLAGLEHAPNATRHRPISETLSNNAPRPDVMNEDLSTFEQDMREKPVPLFCYTNNNRRGTASTGSGLQNNCADNLHRFHMP